MKRPAKTGRPVLRAGRPVLPSFTPRRVNEYRTHIASFEDPDGRRWGIGTDCDRIALTDGLGNPWVFIPTDGGTDLALFAAALAEAIGEARRYQRQHPEEGADSAG